MIKRQLFAIPGITGSVKGIPIAAYAKIKGKNIISRNIKILFQGVNVVVEEEEEEEFISSSVDDFIFVSFHAWVTSSISVELSCGDGDI